MPKITREQIDDINLNPVLSKIIFFLSNEPGTALDLEKRRIGTKRANNYIQLLKLEEKKKRDYRFILIMYDTMYYIMYDRVYD